MEEDGLRAEMVEAAKKFMSTQKVRDSPFEEQRAFLVSKGVTEAEIAEARRLLGESGGEAAHYSPPQGGGGYYYPPPQPQNRFLATAQAALVVGSVSYAGYKFLRSYILPKFFDVPDPAAEETRRLQEQVSELQNSIKFVMDSVAQTSRVLAEQQTEVSTALNSIHSRDTDLRRIETGISTIRSLLLSQSQFVPLPSTAPKEPLAIPHWQRAVANEAKDREEDGDSLAGGYTTPPANFKENGEAEEKEEEATDN